MVVQRGVFWPRDDGRTKGEEKMEALLRSTISPGQFSSEYTVVGKDVNDKVFSFFAPRDYVVCDKPPAGRESAEGWVRVQVWHDYGNRVVVRLPFESFESGQYVTVVAGQLQRSPQGQPVS
jgi:hypothetical protein